MSVAHSPSSKAEPPRSAFQVAADLFDPQPSPYAHDPVGYARRELDFAAWSKQAAIMQAVHDHPRVAVRSSHGPGKTATAAQVAIWFLAAHRNSRVITTAPTWAQVEQLLWREVRASVARAHARGQLGQLPKPSATKLELGEEWFAIGLSTNEPERFQGHHAEFILLVVDEASGVDERIFEAAEGFLTAEGAHLLLVGNPTRVGGQFHRAFTTERDQWHTIHISTFDTPNYTDEPVPPAVARRLPRKGWAEEKAAAWGVDSPMYQVRVLGNFPSRAINGVIELFKAEQAQARDANQTPGLRADEAHDRITISCDVARYGDDETVIAIRVGDRVRIEESWLTPPPGEQATTYAAGRVAFHARRFPAHVTTIVIDDAGLGGGVTDILRDRGLEVVAFNGAERAFQPDDYPNRRSELWFVMADRLPTLDLDPDEQLLADLTSPVYRMNSAGQRVVEPKDDTKKRLGRSPDRADAVLMTLVPQAADVVAEPHERGQVFEVPEELAPRDDIDFLTEQW